MTEAWEGVAHCSQNTLSVWLIVSYSSVKAEGHPCTIDKTWEQLRIKGVRGEIRAGHEHI